MAILQPYVHDRTVKCRTSKADWCSSRRRNSLSRRSLGEENAHTLSPRLPGNIFWNGKVWVLIQKSINWLLSCFPYLRFIIGYCVDESTWTLDYDIAGIDVLAPQFEKAACVSSWIFEIGIAPWAFFPCSPSAEEGLNPSVSDTILLRVSKESSKDWLLVP